MVSLAGGVDAFGVPQENAEDDVDGGRQAIHDLDVKEHDCVVGCSRPRRTPFVLGAIEAALIARGADGRYR